MIDDVTHRVTRRMRRRLTRSRQRDGVEILARSVITGAVAGIVGTWLMGEATGYLYANEDVKVRKREDKARGGKTAYGVAAEKVADVAGVSLTAAQRKKAGSGIHWFLGATAGAVYGAIKGEDTNISPLRGLGFGLVFWAMMDEALTPALGLTRGPKAFPLETHARGLAGHMVLGTSIDAVVSIINRVP